MLNKMPCAADQLNLLEPTMIQSVVEASAFKLGSQYLAENRVRIEEADAVSITSVVTGYSGPYKQTMQLKDGTLITECSCDLTEQPLCRHCVAVLLAYHRWGKPQPPQASPGKPVEARGPEVEAERVALQMVLNTREVEISQLTQQLQASVQDLKAAQSASQAMQRELTQYRVMLGNLSDLAKEWDRYKSQMRAIAGDLEKQGSQLESLSGSVKGASAALQDLAKPQHSTPKTS